MTQIYPVLWFQDHALLIDQNRLPQEYTQIKISRSGEMAWAIKTMVVRGAPAIGVAAAYGLVLGAQEILRDHPPDRQIFLDHLRSIAEEIRSTRPTAVNLFWAVDKMLRAAHQSGVAVAHLPGILLEKAEEIRRQDLYTCQQIGAHGLAVLPATPHRLRLLTHCNAGALATAGYGTALGVVRSAWTEGRLERLYADETRPRLQGARLTAWECVQEGIPVTVITDSMAAHCMQQGLIDAVVVGADRIAANGDTANKIGTYNVALAAQAHGIPFFVAAPQSTLDLSLADGSGIPIEQRPPEEVSRLGEVSLTPAGVSFYNPAFDITPAALITGIITEHGTFKPQDLAAKFVLATSD